MARHRKRKTPPVPTPKVKPLSEKSLWKRIPGWVKGIVVFSTVVITLLEGIPRLAIQQDEVRSPTNPYATLFSVSNEGYMPISDLDATCEGTFTDSGHNRFDIASPFPRFADYLSHSRRVTIPCFQQINIGGRMRAIAADLTVTISYSFYPLTWDRLRRNQKFVFKAVSDEGVNLSWTYK